MAGLMTTREVAEILNVDPQIVRKWIYDGKLEPTARTAGGHYRFSRDHLMEQAARWTREQRSS